jgi:hypothetical protein
VQRNVGYVLAEQTKAEIFSGWNADRKYLGRARRYFNSQQDESGKNLMVLRG